MPFFSYRNVNFQKYKYSVFKQYLSIVMKHIIAQVLYTPADFYAIFLEYRNKKHFLYLPLYK